MDISIMQWIIGAAAGILIGFSKTGMPTIGSFVSALLAMIFPVKESVGIALPMLITADIVAVTYYRRTVVVKLLLRLIPWVLAGIISGFLVLGQIEDQQLSLLIGVLIILLILLHVTRERIEHKLNYPFTQSPVFHAILGILAGFTTMIGNAAGAIMTIYLLSKGLKKNEFIGTGAWFFLSVNLIKVPFSASLGLITLESLTFNACIIPAILLGSYLGIQFLPRIPQRYFSRIILLLAVLGALRLIWGSFQ